MSQEIDYGKTKIVCTLGPASSSVEVLERMIRAGMDVARLNFSHGTHEEHLVVLKAVREAAARAGEPVAILQDLQGPKIRTGMLASKQVRLVDGAQFIITTEETPGDEHRVSTTYQNLPEDVKPGDTILMDDGLLQLKVLGTKGKDVLTEVVHGGILKEHKGINLPGVSVSAPSLTEKDIEDLEFGIANDIDYVALSFVRRAADVRRLKELIISKIDKRKKLPIIAKIEKGEAVENIDEIVAEADAIMVARGDLGVECPTEYVPIAQKLICKKANNAGKPVIIATQMLESMIENPRPTRAEANDVANAVLDGADAVMLSGETSVGKYVVEVVRTMDLIIRRSEVEYRDRLDLEDAFVTDQGSVFRALGRSACVLAKEIGAAAIVPITHSGDTAMTIAKYRPYGKIIAVTDRERIRRRLNLVWGVRSLLVPKIADTDTTFETIHTQLLGSEYVKKGDYIVLTAGIPLLARGTTNTVKVEKIS
ncbi:MAG TPA: pyruvate kinase [Bacteroidota bacterium]|nr:pyruvate kinase [Bacteroidota bacterium]